MQVTFKRQDATAEQTIDIVPDSKLGDSREAAQMLLGLPEHPPCKLILERTKKELEDSLTFKEAGIKHNDKLILSSPTGQEIKPPQEVPPLPVTSSVSPPITSPIQTPPVSNDWKIAVITGSVIGVFIMLGLVVVNSQNPPPNPPSSPQSTAKQQSPSTSTPQPAEPPKTQIPQSISQQEAVKLLQRWLEAKQVMFTSPYNRQIAAEITTGETYQKTAGVDGTIDWLQRNNAYYRYGVQKINTVDNFVVDKNQATIQVEIIEDYTLYKDDKIDPNASGFNTVKVIYNLKLVNGNWKIDSSKIIK